MTDSLYQKFKIKQSMPYRSTKDLPPQVTKPLPHHGEEIFVASFNRALQQYRDEDRARKVAWSAVKRVYQKHPDTGEWVKKNT
jgi:cation transport regulator